jgi:hypothetical protein
MRYALIKKNTVVNLIEYDGEDPYTPPDGDLLTRIPDDQPVDIGWTFDGKAFSAPPMIDPAKADT